MSRKKNPSDEKDIFRRAMRGVTPLKETKKREKKQDKLPPVSKSPSAHSSSEKKKQVIFIRLYL